MHLASEVLRLLKEKSSYDIPVQLGGIIPEEDIIQLKELGVKEVFLPGTPLTEIIEWTRKNVKTRD